MLDLIERKAENDEDEELGLTWADIIDTHANIGRFTRAMWIAVLLLAMFNSGQLVTVVNGLAVGPVQNAVVVLVTTWNDQMEKNKLNEPVAMVRDAVQQLRGATWRNSDDGSGRGVEILRGPVGGTSG
ncbi:MAG: hypothetical protein WA138_11700 [Parvibaculum sp.]